MTSGGNNFNYFPQHQMTKFSAIKANKGGRTKNFKVKVQIICN